MRTPTRPHRLPGGLAALVAVALLAGSAPSVRAETVKAIEDSDITSAVEREFVFDEMVPFNDIDIRTKLGIVMLEGKVKNILARDRAGVVAETVKGVRSVVNLIRVERPGAIEGALLAGDIRRALKDDPAADSFEIHVEADDGGQVSLSGQVDSWAERDLAGQVAKSVRGVTGLENKLVVEFEDERPDAEIRADVKSRLKWDSLVDDFMIEVKVDGGAVKLNGTVGSAAEKLQAVSDSWVNGVKSVDDSGLEVEAWARDKDLRKDEYVPRSDQEIQKAIRDAFLFDPRVFSFDVRPEVLAGWVTLKGQVDNLKAKEAAESVARHTTGVTGVHNRIKVRSTGNLSDAQIEQNIIDRLKKDPWLVSNEIGISVSGGTAYLSGLVDTQFERGHAETVAYGARGVVEVRNQIDVSDKDSKVVYDPYVWSYSPSPWYQYPHYPSKSRESAKATSDERIKEEIESEFFWSPFVDGGDVNVSVENGRATLEGNVDSQGEKDAATENALEGGALSVDNDLVVLSGSNDREEKPEN